MMKLKQSLHLTLVIFVVGILMAGLFSGCMESEEEKDVDKMKSMYKAMRP